MKYLTSITQEELKQQLHYNLETGIFTRLISNNTKFKIGDVAGMNDDMGYIRIKIHGVRYKSHRLAWLYVHGKFPDELIDHKNGIRNDNRICNLREATRQQNNQNVKIRKDNTSGYKGVSYDVTSKLFVASYNMMGKTNNLGTFTSAKQASNSYESATKIAFGEFYKDTSSDK